MDWTDAIATRSIAGCREVLRDDTSAMAAFVAASLLCASAFEPESPFFDEDGELLDYDSFLEILKAAAPDIDDDNPHRIYGLLMASTGDLFFTDADKFEKLSGAIVYGDPYRFDDDDPLLVELVWAIFQVDLMVEGDADSLLEKEVGDRIVEITEDNPEDAEMLAEIDPDFTGSVSDFYAQLLRFRKADLRGDLGKCGVPAEIMEEMGLGGEDE